MNKTNEERAYVEEQQVVEQATEESRWVAGQTLGTENATMGEHPEEWCTSFSTGKADDGNATTIEPGDDRTADDESDGKPNKSGRRSSPRSDRVDNRRRGRMCRRTSVTGYKFRTTREDSRVKLA